MSYCLETLPNGVRILTEPIDSVRSAALGIWVATGSRGEAASESGAAHFIEHMLFKGTTANTAAQLAGRMDAIGGQLNAFTTKECTCFYVHALDSHLSEGLDSARNGWPPLSFTAPLWPGPFWARRPRWTR